MLLPKKTKHRKYQRGRRRGTAKGQTTVQFGDYGLKALEGGWLTKPADRGGSYRHDAQDQARRQGLDQPVPGQSRSRRSRPRRGLGSGKGSPEHWVAVVKPGRVMFELAGVPEPLAKDALRLAGQKLSVKTKIVKREADLFEA
jgi:large subunit ribosomal protein L16